MGEYGVKTGLLDYIAFKVGCMYLSNLHEPQNLLFIQNTLRYIDSSMFGLEEWNDAVEYITGKGISFSTSEQAVEYLFSYKGEKPQPPA